MKKGILIISLLTIILSAQAVKIGLVVEFPDGETFTQCLNVQEETNGYDVLENTNLDLSWSYDSTWGHALCGINGIGCPAENCFCSSDYWGFYIREYGDSSWKYSPVGFDGGGICEMHYCASHGDLLGFAYGPYGTKPTLYSFEEICPSQERRRRGSYNVQIEPENPQEGDLVKITLIDNETSEGIKNAEIEIFAGTLGRSKTIFSGKTNRDGYLEFSLQEAGNYKLRVNTPGYNPPQFHSTLVIVEVTTTTPTTTTYPATTTSTTTITPTTSHTTTTVRSPEGTITPTTSTILATTSTTTTITLTNKELPITGEAVKFPSGESFILFGFLLLLLLCFFTFKKVKRK